MDANWQAQDLKRTYEAHKRRYERVSKLMEDEWKNVAAVLEVYESKMKVWQETLGIISVQNSGVRRKYEELTGEALEPFEELIQPASPGCSHDSSTDAAPAMLAGSPSQPAVQTSAGPGSAPPVEGAGAAGTACKALPSTVSVTTADNEVQRSVKLVAVLEALHGAADNADELVSYAASHPGAMQRLIDMPAGVLKAMVGQAALLPDLWRLMAAHA